ncbi:hypothetical protein diail_8115 [Diaporthe ilicicola]|nr:hypothetical protein diail_8115 [Diaporthe ilicicola]
MNNTLSVNIDTMSTISWYTELSLWLSPISLTIPLALYLFAQYAFGFYKQPSVSKPFPKPWTLYHWPVVGSSIRFFSKRVDMVLEGRDSSANGSFSMFIGTKHVVVLSGEAGRKAFFQTKGLSLPQGFVELLTGKLSSAKDGDYGFSNFSRTFMELIRGHALAERLPILNLDIRAFCDKLTSLTPLAPDSCEWHSVNVSSSVPLLIFKLMHRVVGATEIAESDPLLRDTFSTFLKFERANSGLRTAGDVLASLTLQEWESEFPIIGNCLRETLRLCLPGTVFRRNASGADVPIGDSGEVIPKCAYAAYAISDAHEDPRIYPNTHIFDPSRWDRHPGDGEGAPTSDTYLGFGAGRHLCAGMRLAKLQINLVLAHILSNYDFAPVIGEATMPVPDRNIARLLIPERPMHMRFKSLL